MTSPTAGEPQLMAENGDDWAQRVDEAAKERMTGDPAAMAALDVPTDGAKI